MPGLVDERGKPYPQSMLTPQRGSAICEGCGRGGGKQTTTSFGAYWRVVCKWCGHVSASGRGEPPQE